MLRRGLEESHRGKFHALQTLAAAQDGFLASADPSGAALCAAALMVTGQAMMSYRRFAEHIESLAGLRDGALKYDDRSEDLLAHAGLLAGLLMFAPGDPFCDRCVERITRLLELDVNLRFAAGWVALFYTEPREQRELGNRLNALIEPLMDRPELTPHRLGRWLTFRIRVAAAAKDRLQLKRAKDRAQELVRRGRSDDPRDDAPASKTLRHPLRRGSDRGSAMRATDARASKPEG